MFGGKVHTRAVVKGDVVQALVIRLPFSVVQNAPVNDERADALVRTVLGVPDVVRAATIVQSVEVQYNGGGLSPHPSAPPHFVVRLFAADEQARGDIVCGAAPQVDRARLPKDVRIWGARQYCQSGVGWMAWAKGQSNVPVLGATTTTSGAEYSFDAGSMVSVGLFVNRQHVLDGDPVRVRLTPPAASSWTKPYPTRVAATYVADERAVDITFSDWVSLRP